MKLPLSLAIAFLTGLSCTTAVAATDTVTINLSGTLTKPVCKLTSSKTISVDIGSVATDEVSALAMVDIPVTLNCPANSSLNIGVKAASIYSHSDYEASAGLVNLGYSIYWKSNDEAINLKTGTRKLTGQSGIVDLSMKLKMLSLGDGAHVGTFSTSAVINLEYL
ncbi:fimbrial protein [Pseudomonas sp. CF161]|uniref:fimbrial protein n=1 Tax=Pseudomonas sp. CF161 TaxID=911241 RepID=UPI000355185E|nr:fimbrial protein [Pseudomonas sp. CF161]EPL10045.1 putative fimbrial-like protein [Pseudomonas sp. CF161]